MEKKEILTAILIGVLLITVAIQTVQLVKLSSAEVIVPTTTSTTTSVKSGSAGSSAGAGSSLANLPSMVGGC